MQKTLPALAAAALVLAGCSAFKKSQTWQRVVDNRAGHLAAAGGKTSYADRLHAALAADKVEHKVVAYQFRYRTRLREEAVGAGRAVIYRDAATPGNPWWVTDENTAFPVWVPDASPERQLSFFLRRNAEVLELRDFPEGSDAKSVAAAPAIAAGPEGGFDALFRAMHGTRFDPRSRTDRGKMSELRQAVALE